MTSASQSFDEADLNGFVDGRIEPSRAAALADSLSGDRDARARIDGWKRQNETLRTLFASVLFEPVPVRLLPTTLAVEAASATLASSIPSETWAKPARPKSLGRDMARRTGAFATAAIGLALIGFVAGALTSLGTNGFGLGSLPERGGPTAPARQAATETRSFASRAAEVHQTFLTDPGRPVEIAASDTGRLLKWLQHRLAAPIRIPDLQHQGWTLLGGRIVPGQYGPAGFLVYGNGPDRLGLYIARSPGLRTDGVTSLGTEPEPISISAWGDETFGYALTTNRPAPWLDRNGDALRDAIQAQVRDNLLGN